MKIKHLIALLSIPTFLVLLYNCNQKTKEKKIIQARYNKDSSKIIIADTIIYDVIINKAHPGDSWQDISLKNVNQEYLIDYILRKIDNEELIPRDHITNAPVSKKEYNKLIKSSEFSPDRISKIQFEEIWYLDPDKNIIEKQIISMIFAYELFDSKGELRGYRAAFKIMY
ncbi:MAG: hypothetical protein JXB17_13390 [Bacteroidales bacterium]|nr:hypothetical protein [Bacteroidales bacterium]